MSRIHDALRGARSAAASSVPRAGQRDAVLTALGSRTEGASGRGLLIVGLAAVAGLAGVIIWQSREHDRPPVQRPLPAARSSPPAPTVKAPEVSNVSPASTGSATKKPAPVTAAAARSEHPATAVLHPDRKAARPPDPRPRPSTSGSKPDDFQLALYYHRTGEFDQALVQYKKVLERDALNVEAHNDLGMLYQGKGLYDDAVREFLRVIAIDPSYVTAHLNLSAAYLKLGRADDAALEARRAAALDPRHGDAFVNLALAQEAAGLPRDAQLSLRRALELDPHQPAAHYNLARTYERSGEAALAVEHYRQFLQFAGPEQADYIADARTRVQALTRGNK